ARQGTDMRNKKEWFYFDNESGWIRQPVSLLALEELHAQGKVEDSTQCISLLMGRRNPRASGIPFASLARSRVELTPDVDALLLGRAGEFVTVFCGPNNSGKTLLLRHICASSEERSYLLACNRYSHVDVLNTRAQDENQYQTFHLNFLNNW